METDEELERLLLENWSQLERPTEAAQRVRVARRPHMLLRKLVEAIEGRGIFKVDLTALFESLLQHHYYRGSLVEAERFILPHVSSDTDGPLASIPSDAVCKEKLLCHLAGPLKWIRENLEDQMAGALASHYMTVNAGQKDALDVFSAKHGFASTSEVKLLRRYNTLTRRYPQMLRLALPRPMRWRLFKRLQRIHETRFWEAFSKERGRTLRLDIRD